MKKMWIVGITSIQADLDPDLRGPSEEDIDLFTVFAEEEKVKEIIDQINNEYEDKFVKRHGHAPGDSIYDDYVQFYYAALPEQIDLRMLREQLIKKAVDIDWQFDELFN